MVTTFDLDEPRIVKTSLPPDAGQPKAGDKPLASFLGMFSIGLGLAEVCFPRAMARATGVPHPGLLQAYGAREILAGVGILSSRKPAGWLWFRVAGDVLDLATLWSAYQEAHTGGEQRKILISAAAVAGVTGLDIEAAQEHTRHPL